MTITLHNEIFRREAWDGVEAVGTHKNDAVTASIITDTVGDTLTVSVDLWRSLDKVVAEDFGGFVSVEFTNADGDLVNLRLTSEHAEALRRVLNVVRYGDTLSAETRIES